jgi:hypothetical protein
MTSLRALIVAVCVFATAASADDAAPPTADEIKKVLDYQENGKDKGPILIELLACLKVDTTKGSPTAYTCLEPVGAPLKKNTTVHAWMAWLCPKGGSYEDLTVQFLHEGQVRQTFDLKIELSPRTRTFRSHTFGKSGKWQIKVARGDKELATTSLTVE